MKILTDAQFNIVSGSDFNMSKFGDWIFSAGMGAIANQAMLGAIRGSIAGPAGAVLGAITGATVGYGEHQLDKYISYE